MTVRFERVRPQHFLDIELGPGDKEFEEAFRTEAPLLATLCDPRWSAAAEDGLDTLAIGGVLPDARAWFVLSKWASLRQSYVISLHTRTIIDRFRVGNPGVVVRAMVDGDNLKRVRWAKRMGFLQEGNGWVLKPS